MEHDITLDTHHRAKVKSPYEIKSGGLGPCIALGIYDRKEKAGYMIHTVFGDFFGEVESFCQWVLADCKNNSLSIYTAGGRYEPDEHTISRKITREARHEIVQIVRKWFPKNNITVNWAEPDIIMELVLDTRKGEFICQQTENPEDLDLSLINKFINRTIFKSE